MSAEPPILHPSAAQPDDVSHQASVWFALMHGGSATPAEHEALAAWLDADPLHAQAYNRLEKLWAASALLAKPPAPAVGTPLSRRRFVGLGVAACAVAVTASATTLWLKGIGSPFADLRTAVGERRTVRLADGSTVELAGNTALNIDFSSTQRAVELLQGEVFFNVVPAAVGELSIKTEAGQVLVNNGEFCLSCDGASTLLTVSRRTVRVVTASQQTDLGEGLSLRFSANRAEAIQHAELDQVLAWRNGRLVFFDKPLSAVVSELQRWREGRIFIADTQLAARRVSLILNLNRPDHMLDVLSKALAVRITSYTDLVTIIHAA